MSTDPLTVTSQGGSLIKPPTGKWYCMEPKCRMLNFAPSTICSKCHKASITQISNGSAGETSSGSSTRSTTSPVASNHELSSQISRSLTGLGIGRGSGARILGNRQQYEVGLNGRPKMRGSLPLIVRAETTVIISWVESVFEFYIMRVEDASTLDQITKATCQEAINWPMLETPVVGDSCLCLDETYGCWYRAKILAVMDNSYQIQFVDFGNKILDYKGTIKSLPVRWTNFPELVKKVSLRIEDVLEPVEAATKRLKETTEGIECYFLAHSYDSNRQCYVGSLAIPPAHCDANQLIEAKDSSQSPFTLTNAKNESEPLVEIIQPPPAPALPELKPEYPFTFDKLHRPVLNTTDRRKFLITSAADFDHFYIRDTEKETKRLLFELSDLVNEYMADEDEKDDQKSHELPVAEIKPAVGEVYLVKHQTKDGKKYFRGVVEQVTKGLYFQMRNVDNGRLVVVCKSDLAPITDEIFQIPVLAYEVKLAGFENSPNLLLKDDFDKFIANVQAERELFKLESVKCVDSNTIASFKYENGNLLVTKILELRKWPWEHFYDLGFRTDNEIIKKEETVGLTDVHDIVDLELPLKMDIEVVIIGVVVAPPTEKKQRPPRIEFKPITKYTADLQQVFTNQLKNYTEKISESSYYPGAGEMAFVLPPEGYPGAGEWQRCIRVEIGGKGIFCSIDSYARYPIQSDDHFIIRRIIMDFMRLPALAAIAELHNPTYNEFMINSFQRTFLIGEKVTIRLLKKLEQNLFTFESDDLCENFRILTGSDIECSSKLSANGADDKTLSSASED